METPPKEIGSFQILTEIECWLGGTTIYYGAKRGVYTILAKNHTFFHCFEDCERRRVSVALGFWEACGSYVGRMTLRGFGLISNINGDRVWSRGSHFGI